MKFVQFCQIYGFGGDMGKRILVWRISWESGHHLVKPVGLVAIGTNNFLSGEFHVFFFFFGGKWSFVSLGVAMEV